MFHQAISAKVRRKAIAMVVNGSDCRIAACEVSNTCRSDHRPGRIHFAGYLRRSLHEESFAVGTVTCGSSIQLMSIFNKVRSLGRRLVHYIKSPEREFSRSTLHVLHTMHFSTRLSFPVRPSATGTIGRLTPGLGGVDTRHVRARLIGLLASPRPRHVRSTYRLKVAGIILPR